MIKDELIIKTLKGIITDNPYINILGIELLELDYGYAKGKMKFSEKLCNPYGSMHGGCLFSLADIIAGIAACTYGNYVSTISGNMNYISPAMNTDNIYCTAHVIKEDKKNSFCNVEIVNDNGEILETGSFTFYTLDKSVS